MGDGMSTATSGPPETSVDLFGPELAADPYEVYRELRDLGRAVFVPEHNFWLISRYDDVRSASVDWKTWTAAKGVALLDQFNEPMLGTILATDPPGHDVLRSVLAEQLAPRSLTKLRDAITEQVDGLVESALAEESFDVVPALTSQIPVQVVADLIGLPKEGREVLLPGADAVFNTFGPFTPTVEERFGQFMAYQQYMGSFDSADSLSPGSWGADIYAAAGAGRIGHDDAGRLLMAYLVAGMDTTSNGLTSMIELFATRPEVWDRIKADPETAGPIFEETLRTESPVQGFFRVATQEVTFDDVVIPAGGRVLLHFGSANRDGRKYPEPDTFQIERNPVDHLAFGYGVHACAGQGLARLEARALVAGLLARGVDSFELTGPSVRHVNAVVRGLESLPIRLSRS
jgi:cytochrome P450